MKVEYLADGIEMILGDAREGLRSLPDKLVQTMVTSPPYFNLRDYGVAGQIGLEETPEQYVAALVSVFREVRRVLRDDGTVWLNIGDSYNSSPPGANPGGFQGAQMRRNAEYNKAHPRDHSRGRKQVPDRKNPNARIPEMAANRRLLPGLKPKDLIGIPWMVAFALRADGWYLRSDIIWAKPNHMPEGVTDRPTKQHEYIFLLSKSANYYYDQVAIAEVSKWYNIDARAGRGKFKQGAKLREAEADGVHYSGVVINQMRNKRSVWTVNTEGFPGAHFATFPPNLIEPCILAGTSEKGCCSQCGAPWKRQTKKTWETIGWEPSCECNADVVPCVVLDPFTGSGTTGAVSRQYGRDFIGIELSPKYFAMACNRIQAKIDAPLLTEAAKLPLKKSEELPWSNLSETSTMPARPMLAKLPARTVTSKATTRAKSSVRAKSSSPKSRPQKHQHMDG